MAYVDGFLIPLPKKNKAAYKKMARRFGKVCMEFGATSYHECIADDVKVGKLTSFPRALKLKKNELVMFSWVVTLMCQYDLSSLRRILYRGQCCLMRVFSSNNASFSLLVIKTSTSASCASKKRICTRPSPPRAY